MSNRIIAPMSRSERCGMLVRRVDRAEPAEEVPLAGRGVRHARVAEQCPRTPTRSNSRRGTRVTSVAAHWPWTRHMNSAVRLSFACRRLAPRHDAGDGEMDQGEQHDDGQRADEDRPRDGPGRVADLAAEVADVVVAEVRVDREAHARRRERGRSRSAARSAASDVSNASAGSKRIAPSKSTQRENAEDADEEDEAELAERGDAAVEQGDDERRRARSRRAATGRPRRRPSGRRRSRPRSSRCAPRRRP